MNKYHPADYSGDGTGSVVVQVTSGDTATSLAPALVKLGVVASSRAFVLAAEHSPSSSGLLPGFYGMHQHMQASLAYAILINPKNMVQIKVTIPEGWRLSQVVSFLGAKSGIPLSAYQKVLKDPAPLHLPGYANGKPEGYLFPATYNVQPHETALGVLTGMVQRFNEEAANVSLPAAARQVHLTEAQVVVVASLVQAEGGRLLRLPEDRPGDLQPASARHAPAVGQHGALRSEQVRHPRQRQGPHQPVAVQHLQAQGPAARSDRQPGRRGHPGRAAPGGRHLAVLRDGEPEDRRDPLHLEPAQFQSSGRNSRTLATG